MKRGRRQKLENVLEPGAKPNFSEISDLRSGEKKPTKKQKFLTLSGEDLLKKTEKKSTRLSLKSDRSKSSTSKSREDGKPGRRKDGETGSRAKPGVDMSRVAKVASKKGAKAQRSKAAKKAAKTRAENREKGVRGDAVASFDRCDEEAAKLYAATGKARARMLAVLGKSNASKEKRALVKELASEFARQYTRWRRKTHKSFQIHSKEQRYVNEAAVLCFERGVTPAQHLRFWVVNIERFQLRYAPLSMLASPANVDNSASFYALNGADADPARLKRGGDKTNEAAGLHGYADTKQLHGSLRGTLEAGGFDVSEWSDRDLMSIQNAAKAIAAGHDLFVSRKMRPMVDRALRLFRKAGK